MNKSVITYKYRYKTFKLLRSSICCFIPLTTRLIKGKIHLITFSNDILYLDFGFKREVELFKNELKLRVTIPSLKETCNYIKRTSMVLFNVIVLETAFFNKVSIEKQKNIINLKLFYYIFFRQNKKNKSQHHKYYIKGRFFNVIKGGFAVGICGYIAFLPLSHALFKKFGLMSLFHVLTIDIEKQIFVVSQSKINSLLRKQLKKLKSRFFILKNNINPLLFSKVDITQYG